MQKYSIDNQEAAIAIYAAGRDLQIVKTYSDAGKSGLQIKGRDGLARLIADIEGGHADFGTLLVYDVSRWGRFQDVDESAHYEFICRQAGISIRYCAEEFENDGSLSAAIFKTIKRAMAAEYSRELSNRIFLAKCNMTLRGFRHGGRAGFGLRRMVLDEDGRPRGILENGQQKFVHSDRTILVPGPPDEVNIVTWIFEQFVRGDVSINAIARDLNARGVQNSIGRPWHGRTVRALLANEKYVGDNVFNKTSLRLKSKRVRKTPAEWVRADRVFAPIVTRPLFEQAQAKFACGRLRAKKSELLDHLTAIWCVHGALSATLMAQQTNCPSTSTYTKYFGSLLEAFKEVGYPRLTRRPVYVSVRRSISDDISDRARAAGGTARWIGLRRQTRILINEQLKVTIALAHWAYKTRDGRPRWVLKHSVHHDSDIVVLARFDEKLRRLKDYFLLPGVILDNPQQVLLDANHVRMDAFRSESLDPLQRLFARQVIDRVPRPGGRQPVPKVGGAATQGLAAHRHLATRGRTARVVRLFRSFEFQSNRMRSLIEQAQIIAGRQSRLERDLKLLLSDSSLCRILFDEGLDLWPAIVLERVISGIQSGSPRQQVSGRAAELTADGSKSTEWCGLLRKVSAERQEEIADLMALSADATLGFLRVLVLATDRQHFVRAKRCPRGVRPKEMRQVEHEVGLLEQAFRKAVPTYVEDAYALSLTEAWVRALLKNVRVGAYLRSVHPKPFAAFSHLPKIGAPIH